MSTGLERLEDTLGKTGSIGRGETFWLPARVCRVGVARFLKNFALGIVAEAEESFEARVSRGLISPIVTLVSVDLSARSGCTEEFGTELMVFLVRLFIAPALPRTNVVASGAPFGVHGFGPTRAAELCADDRAGLGLPPRVCLARAFPTTGTARPPLCCMRSSTLSRDVRGPTSANERLGRRGRMGFDSALTMPCVLVETLLGAGWRAVAGLFGVAVFLRAPDVPRGFALECFGLDALGRSAA